MSKRWNLSLMRVPPIPLRDLPSLGKSWRDHCPSSVICVPSKVQHAHSDNALIPSSQILHFRAIPVNSSRLLRLPVCSCELICMCAWPPCMDRSEAHSHSTLGMKSGISPTSKAAHWLWWCRRGTPAWYGSRTTPTQEPASFTASRCLLACAFLLGPTH